MDDDSAQTGFHRVRRAAVLLLVPLYVGALVVGGWPAAIRPAFLDPVSDGARAMLRTVSLTPGLPVFAGTTEATAEFPLVRCVVAMGWDAEGTAIPIHAHEPCPPRGFRWRPDIYEQMLFHWTWKMHPGRVTPNMMAMADHFCHRLPDQEIDRVKIGVRRIMVDYETGQQRRMTQPITKLKCRN